jgi:hypothetical protein
VFFKRPATLFGETEYHVIADNEATGTKSVDVFVPLDYSEALAWPVIFRHKGRGGTNTTLLAAGEGEW